MNQTDLKIGRRVKTNREFSGVGIGTIGEIVAASNSWPESESVAVAWDRPGRHPLTDWFALDELEFLDLAE